MEDTVCTWLERPRADRSLRLAGAGSEWQTWTYEQLATHTRRTAKGLVCLGVQPDDVVTVIERSGPNFLASLFGTMLAGATASPVAPPMAFQDPDMYREHVVGLLDVAQPSLIVTEPELRESIAGIATASVAAARVVTFDDVLSAGDDGTHYEGRAPANLALLQFTSGSSGRARGVQVTHDALRANVDAILYSWLRLEPGENASSAFWLPMHHDMGLIGGLIAPTRHGSDLWLLEPEDFIRKPVRFLGCFGRLGAQITAMPNFALAYIARRVRPGALEGMDFSGWRALIVGAERVDLETLERFTELLAPFGFDRSALLPAYGLAEATLAVAAVPVARGWRSCSVDAKSLAVGAAVEMRAADDGGQSFVGCGLPLGVSVTIEDDSGTELPEGCLGEIVVRGESVAASYAATDRSESLTRLADGTLHTGDAGFVSEGELFIVGRLGDSVKVRGRAVFAEDLEAVLVKAGIPEHRVAAVLGLRDGSAPTVVIVFEQGKREWIEASLPLLRRRAEGAEIVVLDAPKGAIARTSSGKPKRRLLWESYVHGDLTGTTEPGPREAVTIGDRHA